MFWTILTIITSAIIIVTACKSIYYIIHLQKIQQE